LSVSADLLVQFLVESHVCGPVVGQACGSLFPVNSDRWVFRVDADECGNAGRGLDGGLGFGGLAEVCQGKVLWRASNGFFRGTRVAGLTRCFTTAMFSYPKLYSALFASTRHAALLVGPLVGWGTLVADWAGG
jgi:hypothetical protein